MHFADLVRSFLPLQNPIGFGASDFIEIILAGLVVLLALISRPYLEPWMRVLAPKTGCCMLLSALLPVGLRLALLPHHPVPSPEIYDEFSHLLVADTLRHFRLANPPHPLHQFFETFFVLQEPTYSSIYPLGQGLAMEFGRVIFRTPWAGVLLFTAAFCSLCYWMLLAWTTPVWALIGALLAVAEFGPLNQWMNSYWGGAVSATAGCLVFGSLPRLRKAPRTIDAAILGLGLGIQLLTRPYEFIFLLVSALVLLFPLFRTPAKVVPAFLVLLPAIGLTFLQNKQVTGSWSTLPYMLSQYQYGVPAALTFQSNAVPHNDLTPQQQLDYKMQLAFRPNGPETIRTYLTRLAYRIRFYRFFFLVPLYLVIPAFFFAMRELRFAWVGFTLLLFAIGVNFFPFFQSHYIAAVTCLFVLVSVIGLQQLSCLTIRGWPVGGQAARIILSLCAIHFIFWYGLHVFETANFSLAMRRYETWDVINHTNPERRIAVNAELAKIPGKLLVFVRYSPQHIFQDEWVYNAADIDGARIVWARDLGAENQKLQNYYPDRSVWLLEPDSRPPQISPYKPPIQAPVPTPQPSPLRFEQVH
jgi:hypothetical protein